MHFSPRSSLLPRTWGMNPRTTMISKAGSQAYPLSRHRCWGHVGTLDLYQIQQQLQLRHVMPVRSSRHYRQRDAAPVHQKVPLAAFFPPGPFPTDSVASGAFVMQPSANPIRCHAPRRKAGGPQVSKEALLAPVPEIAVYGA